MSAQLPLGLALRASLSFDNFIAGENAEAQQLVQATAANRGERLLFLWGAPGTGKTHLLQAACHAATQHSASAVYVPLREALRWSIEMLDGLDQFDLICLDDVEALAQARVWEEAVFHLFNRAQHAQARMLFAADSSPAQLRVTLPDLRSRFAAGVTLQLKPLGEEQKIRALQQRARQRGFELADDVAQFLLRRSARDMDSLFQLLERLDQASLVAQRKLTIPFVRNLI